MAVRAATIGVKLAVTIYIARFVGLKELGVYGLIVGLAQVVPVTVRCGLLYGVTRELAVADRAAAIRELKHYAIWIVCVYAVLVPAAIGITASMGQTNLVAWVAAIAGVVVAEHLAVDAVMLFNSRRRPDLASQFGLAQAFAWAGVFMALGLVDRDFRSLTWLMTFWIGGTTVVLAVVAIRYVPVGSLVQAPVEARWFCERLTKAFLLFLYDVVSTVSVFADRYLVAFLLSLEMAGVYTFFLQISNALFTLINASIIPSHQPDLIALYRRGADEAAVRRLRIFQVEALGILATLSVGAVVLFWQAVPLLKRPLIEQSLPLLACLLAATWVRVAYQTEAIRYFASYRDRRLLAMSSVGFMTVLVLAFVLSGPFGAYGMAAATFLSFALLLCIAVAEHGRAVGR